MLDKLLTLETMGDITSFGMTLFDYKSFAELQMDLAGLHILFMIEDYWTEDKLSRYTATEKDLHNTIHSIEDEPIAVRALHMLQLVQRLCPAVAPIIEQFLKRTTC